MKSIYIFKPLVFTIFSLAATQVCSQAINIDVGTTHQTIRGFGGMNHTVWIDDLNEDQREKAFGNDPGQLGLSILRMHVDPNTNVWDREVPTALHALANDALVFATPWDPPAQLLDPNNTTLNKIPYANYDAYVDHLNSFDDYMTNSGVPLYAISVQNEPDYGEGWTRWTADEMLTFMQENAQDINNRVMAPESFQFRRSYSDRLLNDQTASDNLDIMGGHIYGGGLSRYGLAENKGKEVWMTEHYTSSDRSADLWPDALGVGREIHNCMEANFNAYVWWYIRRFYGLILDDGNISKRGHVFSHFSKFIRPGYQRVEVATNSSLNASAYKSNDDLVIVVVNSANTTRSIEVDISNGSVNQMTSFVTSEDRNMENMGTITLTNGNLVSSIGPQSIVTFTTKPEYGGKASNSHPIAFAGDDFSISDDDIDGVETINFDGTGSLDSDGTIVNYSWSIDGNQVSFLPSEDIDIALGLHEVVLTVTDNDGATGKDTMTIEVKLSESEDQKYIWLDAECGEVGSNWLIEENPDASNGKYVRVINGTQSLASASNLAIDKLVFSFEIETAGVYKLWGNVRVPSADDDSFWVKMDDDDWILWNSISGSGSWGWDDIHNSNGGGNAQTYDLTVGSHTLEICYREDGADLDKLLLTNTGVIPTGLGETSEICNVTNNIDQSSPFTSVKIYPNPSGDGVFNISGLKEVKQIEVLNLHGKIISRINDFSIEDFRLDITAKQGMYLVKFVDINNAQTIRKIIIQ